MNRTILYDLIGGFCPPLDYENSTYITRINHFYVLHRQ